jgi:nudix-type nucleoside diphosphatase (YffH/AdpP family)
MDRKVVIHRQAPLIDDFFRVDEAYVSFERFDGTMSVPARRLCFERGDSVAAIVYNRDTQRVLLVEQFRYAAYTKGPGWITEVIAGIVGAGESPEAALRREMLEEIGFEAGELRPIGTFFLSPGGSSERVSLYFVEVCAAGRVSQGGGEASEGEDTRVVEFTIGGLRDALTRGAFQDAKTLVGVMWLLSQDRAIVPTPGP